MKNFVLYSLLLLLYCSTIFSQENRESGFTSSYDGQVFNSKDNVLNLLSTSQKSNNELITMTQDQYYGGVLVKQIGDYNVVNAQVISKNSEVKVLQNGNQNEFSLSKEARSISQNVIQQGQNNTITDYSFKTNYDVKTQMIQKGNDQSIQSYGTNSISKDLKVTQSGNGASVIILNKLN